MSLLAKVGLTVAADNLSKLHIMDRSSFQVQERNAEPTKPHLSRTSWKFRMRGQRHPAGPLEVLLPGASGTTGPDCFSVGFPGGSKVEHPPANAGHVGSIPGRGRGGEIPWRRKWQPTPVFLPGESHGRWSLVGYSPRGRKESDTTEVTKHIHTLFLCILGCSALECQKLVSSIC